MITVHFTITGYLTSFKETFDRDDMSRDEITKELNERIAREDIRHDGHLARVREVFYIDHITPKGT